jgi:hypothetical protein
MHHGVEENSIRQQGAGIGMAHERKYGENEIETLI